MPDPQRIEAIITLPVPEDLTTLQLFLGAIYYYGKFVKSKKKWSINAKTAESDQLLLNYNPNYEIVSAGAPNYGLGACINHSVQDRLFAMLLGHYKRTSEITDRSIGVCCCQVPKYNHLIYGTRFVPQTYHKPLVSIFRTKICRHVIAVYIQAGTTGLKLCYRGNTFTFWCGVWITKWLGDRPVMPSLYSNRIFQKLHSGHSGKQT